MGRAAFFCVDLFEIPRSTDWTCNFFLCTTHKEWRLERKTGNEKPKKKKAKHVWYCNNTSARITPAAMKNVCRSFEECFLFLFLFREIFTSVFFCGRPYNLSCHGWLKVRLARLKGLTEHSKVADSYTAGVFTILWHGYLPHNKRNCPALSITAAESTFVLRNAIRKNENPKSCTKCSKIKLMSFFHAGNFPLVQPHY